MDKNLNLSYAILLSLLPCQIVFAKTDINPHKINNKENKEEVLVVSASRTEKSLWNTPVTMQIIDEEQLRSFSGDSMAEALRDIPGVVVSDYAMPGRKQIRIRGEISERVLILIDGQEVSYQRTNGAGLLIDSESLERIEVIKGPHSVLYGSRAIGGVVNFITRKGGSKAIQGDIKTGYDTSANGNFQSGSIYGSANGFDYRLSGSRMDYGNRRTPDGRLDNTDFSNDMVSGWFGYHVDNQKIGLSLEHLRLDTKTFASADTLGPEITQFDIDIPKMEREKIGLFYDLDNEGRFWKKTHVDLYYQTISREFRNHVVIQPAPVLNIDTRSAVDDKQTTRGANLQLDFEPFYRNTFIVGGQYLIDHVDQNTTNRSQMSMNGNARPETIKYGADAWQQESWSLFAQNEWQFADDWSWSLGARQYWLESKALHSTTEHNKTSGTDNTMVGATSLRYSGFKDTELRLSYAQGYVYPTLFKQFAESSDAGKVVYGNPDLKAERSDNIEFGIRYKGNDWLMDSAVYYSKARDYITTVSCDRDHAVICHNNSGDTYLYYTNANKANTYGLEFQIEYNAWDLVPYLAGNLMHREFELETKTTHKTGTPNFTAKAGVKNTHYFDRFDLESNFFLRMASETNDNTTQNNDKANHKGGWTTANLEFNGYMGSERQYRAGLQLNNLLNQRYITANETVPASGFGAIFSVGMSF